MVGLSGIQITKLLLIDTENEELIDLIDKGILIITPAYIQTTRIKKERESRLEVRKNNKRRFSAYLPYPSLVSP